MIMSDLYKTQLTADKYNVSINSTNNANKVRLTVKLLDYNNEAVTGKNVRVSVNEGYFIRSEGGGTYSYSGTSTKSVTNTTNSRGEFTVDYIANTWGIVTFIANETTLQVKVTGWKKILSSPTIWGGVKFDAYTNGEYVFIQFDSGTATISTSENVSYATNLPSEYCPLHYIYTPAGHYPRKNIEIAMNEFGTIYVVNKSNSTSTHVSCCLFYPIIK